jgi:hypothetical protein
MVVVFFLSPTVSGGGGGPALTLKGLPSNS